MSVLVTVRGFTSFFEISTISCALLMEKNQAEKTVDKLRSTSHFCLCELLDGNEEEDHYFLHACVKSEHLHVWPISRRTPGISVCISIDLLKTELACVWKEIDSLADPRGGAILAIFGKNLAIIGFCLKLRGWCPRAVWQILDPPQRLNVKSDFYSLGICSFFSRSLIFSNFTGWVTIH